jgi:hypothetical protein
MDNADLLGEWISVFDPTAKPVAFKAQYSSTLEPWSYQVLRFKKQ